MSKFEEELRMRIIEANSLIRTIADISDPTYWELQIKVDAYKEILDLFKENS